MLNQRKLLRVLGVASPLGRALGLRPEPPVERRLGHSASIPDAGHRRGRGAEGAEGPCPFSPPKRLPPSFLRLRCAPAPCSRVPAKPLSPSNPTARAAPRSSEALLRGNERERAMTTNTVTTTTTDINLAKLIPCPANVRRTGAGAGIEALAASIQAHGLLQALVVRPKLDGEGQPGDRFEVVSGGRRLAALKLLAKQKRITKGAIPVVFRPRTTWTGPRRVLREHRAPAHAPGRPVPGVSRVAPGRHRH